MAITTKELIKSDYLNITVTDYDDMIDRFIIQAGIIIKDYCRQPIEQESITKYFDGDGSNLYELFYTVPCASLTLSYRNSILDTWTTAASGTYALHENKIYNDNGFAESYYKVVLSVGYASASVPKSIVDVCSEIVVALFKQTAHSSATIGVSGETITQGGVTTARTFNDVLRANETKLFPYQMIWL